MEFGLVGNAGGPKYGVAATVKNELLTRAATHTEAHENSIAATHWSVGTGQTADTLTITATGGPILYLANGYADYNVVVSRLIVYSGTAGLVAKVVRSPTLGAIGNENTATPVNLNFGSSAAPDVTVYTWDEVGDGMTGLTSGSEVAPIILAVGANELEAPGNIVVPPGQNFYVNIASAGEASILCDFYREAV